jgi:predicted NAD-dependent protein-ADP-ribosyltransferase YbiA (DUF1768 family)
MRTILLLAAGLFGFSFVSCAQQKDKSTINVQPEGLIVFKTGEEYGKANGFPQEWWGKITTNDKASWEIAPDEAQPKTVILSKRTELGILSNFAATPFVIDGKGYASIEGFWQATKYPDLELPDDPRFQLTNWPMKREQVEKLSGFEAKDAGTFASKILKEAGIDWVSYKGLKMIYREPGESTFYQLVRRAMIEKLRQNQKVREVLLRTKDLRLLPDHTQEKDAPKAWGYHLIWEDLRELAKKQLI